MSGVQKPVWVFMDNYKHLLFDDERFWAAFGRTFYFTMLR